LEEERREKERKEPQVPYRAQLLLQRREESLTTPQQAPAGENPHKIETDPEKERGERGQKGSG
jgi:hypothetical protein